MSKSVHYVASDDEAVTYLRPASAEVLLYALIWASFLQLCSRLRLGRDPSFCRGRTESRTLLAAPRARPGGQWGLEPSFEDIQARARETRGELAGRALSLEGVARRERFQERVGYRRVCLSTCCAALHWAACLHASCCFKRGNDAVLVVFDMADPGSENRPVRRDSRTFQAVTG